MAIVKKVEELMKKALKANSSDIEEALIKPISAEWPFATNGVSIWALSNSACIGVFL
jgi:hypothetical protein